MKSKKSFFDWTVFKKTVLRFWPVWAAYSAVWLVTMPLNGLMMLRLEAEAYPGVTGGYLESFARNTVTGLTEASLFLALLFGALAAMAVFSHLYNARSANLFGSLPIRREGLFLTHYLAGLAFLIVPNVAVFLLTLAVEAAGGAVFMSGLLFWLAVTCGEGFFFYSFAVFCGMFTGHILALPAFYCIFNGLAYGLYLLLEGIFREFYYGFNGFESGASAAVAWLTPVLRLARSVNFYLMTGDRIDPATGAYLADVPVMDGLDSVAVYAAAALALTVGAFFLYRARWLESAGDVVSVKAMRPVFKYSVALCAGLCFGMATASIVDGGEATLMISILVWAAAGYFVAQMLLDKTFRVFRKWKGAAAVAGVFVLLFLVVGFDLTGYETRIPGGDQVEYVKLHGINLDGLGDSGDYGPMTVDGPAAVELVRDLHRAAVEQRDKSMPGEGSDMCCLEVTYHLKNGSTLSRFYNMWVEVGQVEQEHSAAWAIQQLYNDRELYWERYGFEEAERRLAEEGYRLNSVTRKNYEDGDPWRYYYGRDAQALYEAVKEDFRAGRIGVRTVGGGAAPDDQLEISFARDTEQDYGTVQYQITICVQDTADSTLAVLKRLEANLDDESIRDAFEEWLK